MSFLSAIKNFFVGSPTAKIEESAGVSAPYKIPEPAATATIPLVAEVAPAVAVKKTPAPKKPAAAPKKPVAAKAVVRKPRPPKA